MKKLFYTLLFFSPVAVFAQITFDRNYNAERPVSAYEYNNGYILGGVEGGPILIKTDLYGDTVWTKIIPGINAEYLNDMIKTNDGGFLFLDSPSNLVTKSNIWLIKTDGSGNLIWYDSIVKPNYDEGSHVIQTSDNGYMVAGQTNSLPGITGPYPYDAYIVKTNSLGDSTYTKNYGRVPDNDYAWDVIETSDSKYVFAGYGEDYGINKDQVYLIKTKPNGDTIWTRNIGGTDNEQGYCIKETSDNKYIIAGTIYLSDSYSDVYMVKTDTSGDVLWQKTYDFNTPTSGERMLVLGNGYLILGEIYNSVSESNLVLLIRTNNLGDTLWTKKIQSNYQLGDPVSIAICSDNGYLITSETVEEEDGSVLMKTDSLGCIKPSVNSITGEPDVSIYDTITFHNYSLRGSWYYWYCGSGTIVSGQGTDQVNIYWTHTGIDTLYSVTSNECGSDTASYLVHIDSCVVPEISSITGDLFPPLGSIAPYYVNKIEGKKPINYHWTLNYDTIQSGQGTDTVTIEWNHLGMHYLTVLASNECGSDTSSAVIDVFIGGISDNSVSNSLNVPVYPNPVKNVLYLKFPDGYDCFEVKIVDVYGRQKYCNTMLSGLNEINISDQPDGMYFLKIRANNKILIKKIVLAK
jgi:hypothetical protein